MGTYNPIDNKANHLPGEADIPVKEKADHLPAGVENPVNDKADHPCGEAESSVNDEAHHLPGQGEIPVNNKADPGEAGKPVNDKADDRPSEAENHVNEKIENLTEEGRKPVNDKADQLPGAVEKPVNDKAGCLPEEAKDILKSLAGEWDDVCNVNALQVIPLKGAMTNEVFQIKWPTKTEAAARKVLVRVYGEGVDVFFDRDDEIKTCELMSKHGQGPRLLGRFANGRVEEFIHARTLSASDLRDPVISALIAAKMKEFHDLDVPGPKKIHLWDRLRNWLNVAKRLSSPEEAQTFALDTIEGEIAILEKEISGDQQRIGFCHNDLQYGNIMFDEETKSVTIIDYEYSSYNPIAFDIANHFCEMAADYHTDTPHILDYSKYPDLEERKKFVLAYLSSSGEKPSDEEVDQLLEDVEKYTLANNLFWGVWGIISAHVNKIDFDYIEYAKQRIKQYWSKKPSLLGSAGASPDGVTDGNTAGPSSDSVADDDSSGGKGSSRNAGMFRKFKKFMTLNLFRSRS